MYYYYEVVGGVERANTIEDLLHVLCNCCNCIITAVVKERHTSNPAAHLFHGREWLASIRLNTAQMYVLLYDLRRIGMHLSHRTPVMTFL